MSKYKRDYKKIDELCAELNLENSGRIKKPKKKKSVKIDTQPRELPKKRVIKRKAKQQTKEEERISQYVQDRVVVMQIETKSQPYNSKMNNQSNSILEQSNTKNSIGAKK